MDILFVNVIYMAYVNLCDPYLNLSLTGWGIGVLLGSKKTCRYRSCALSSKCSIKIMCWQVRGKYDTIEAMLYKETGQYGKQIGDFFWFHAWSTFPLEGVLEAAIQRQKTELDRVGADYKEAAGFRLNQLFWIFVCHNWILNWNLCRLIL